MARLSGRFFPDLIYREKNNAVVISGALTDGAGICHVRIPYYSEIRVQQEVVMNTVADVMAETMVNTVSMRGLENMVCI